VESHPATSGRNLDEMGRKLNWLVDWFQRQRSTTSRVAYYGRSAAEPGSRKAIRICAHSISAASNSLAAIWRSEHAINTSNAHAHLPAPCAPLILLAYLIAGALYATSAPFLEVSNEARHYAMVEHLAQGNELPIQDALK